jgi:hypothetical protein
LRYAASECFGRITTFLNQNSVNALVKNILENTVKAVEPIPKVGFLTALTSVLRFSGGMGATSYLQSSIGILHNVSSDPNPVVHGRALHAISVGADSCGLMFQPYVHSTLNLVVKLYLSDVSDTFERDDPSFANQTYIFFAFLIFYFILFYFLIFYFVLFLNLKSYLFILFYFIDLQESLILSWELWDLNCKPQPVHFNCVLVSIMRYNFLHINITYKHNIHKY